MATSPNNPSRLLVASKMPGTLVELRRETGLARSTVARAVEVLHAANAGRDRTLLACRIVRWQESAAGANSPYLAVFKLGRGKDAPCPVAPRTPSGDCNGRARIKALEEADRAAVTKDPWLWWCFDVNVTF